MADPASPGDDDADTPSEGMSESDADTTEEAGDTSTDRTKLEEITGVGPARADALREAGFASVADVRTATPAELSEANGIGGTIARQIRDEVGSTGDGGGDTEGDGGGDTEKSDPGDDTDGDDTAEQDDSGRRDDDTDGDDADGDDTDGDSGDGETQEDDGETQDDEGGEMETGQNGGSNEIEPLPDDEGGLLGYGKAGGPEADEEMPLTAHIEEMIKRLVIVAVVAGVVSLMTFPFADWIINFLWDSILPTGAGSDFARPRLYSVLEFWFTKVKVASLAGVIIGLPVFVYQTYRFMRPGLYPNERRYYLAAVPTSLVLALVGMAFAYFIVLPSVFTYFLYYSEDVTTIGFALGRTFNLILIMMGYLAIVFQIPLFIMLAMLMGLVTREWLAQRRLIFWGAFLGISFVFSPDPTGMVPILITLTMIALFEATLLLTKWTQARGGGGERGIGA